MARPVWEYQDSAGVEHIGYLDRTFDDGRTYAFRSAKTNELTVVSGALLKNHAHRIWTSELSE